jgi:NAD(P)-dependent dehydrogenase (short-subunit alcohol dehydrogenase family)
MQGTTHLILGASGGIGSALARDLASQGARLVLGARRLQPLAELQAGLPAGSSAILEVEASSFAAVEAACQTALTTWGRLDGIACCVGSILLKPAHLTSEAEWAATIAQNATAAFACVQAAGKHMKDGGSVVLFGSGAADIGLPNHEAIAAAKAAVEGLARAAAATYAARGLRVNVVSPGLVRTPLATRLVSSPQALQASTALHAAGRIGEADDVARMAAFLLDPRNAWITGSVLRVDGGLSRVRAKG